MNILLCTYSYYPYNWGGTEVYVHGLAKYLTAQGHYVRVVAGMPPEAFAEQQAAYEDDQLKSVAYNYEDIDITGVVLKNETTQEIYKKFREAWVGSWEALFASLPTPAWDIVHLHAHTSVLGEALLQGIKKHSENVKVFAAYHVPVSCSKGTLMFAGKLKECAVKPTVNICAACVLSTRTNIPFALFKTLMPVFPTVHSQKLPVAVVLKSLVSEFIMSFSRLDQYIHQWHVFSNQIHNILLLNGVEPHKLFLLRHGAGQVFFDRDNRVANREAIKPVTFLFASRLTAVKGFDTLLKAWCSMEKTAGRQLWLAGEANDHTIAEERDDITWLGEKTQAQLAAVMQQVHCVIIPSEWVEIGPLVFHEAIAAGCDVIASDIGGCKELATVYKNKSTLFEAGNARALAAAVKGFTYSGSTMDVPSNTRNFEQVCLQYMHHLKAG